jgi:hypothetical protein
MTKRLLPLITKDPATGADLIVTRLESPDSGIVIEGQFDLGWIGRLTREQLDFVGLLLRYRTNLQKLADELGIAYNTARSRLDDVVTAIGEPSGPAPKAAARPDPERAEIIDRLSKGELSVDEAIEAIKKRR